MSGALERIINSKRLPVLFIGSGLSKRYLNDFPSWEQLLDQLRETIGISKSAYSAKKHTIRSQHPSITTGKLNQKMASYLQEKFLNKIENEEIDTLSIFTEEENDRCIEKGIDYFKMLVAKLFSSYTVNTVMNQELDLLKKVGQKTSMVFTTNYDLFLEKDIFPNFKVYENQNKYFFRTNNEYGELYKIHGSIEDPNGMILCEKDYDRFDATLKLVSSKLLNALMDFPIIFLGYSLEDENIKKIITDFVSSFDDNILQDVKKFMILVIYEQGQDDLIEGEKQFTDSNSGRSITLTTIKTDNFAKIYENINQLKPSASTYELRKYKTMVADLISRCAKGEQKIFVQELDAAAADERALYIGSRTSIEGIQKSVNIYKNEDIIKKALIEEPFEYDMFAQYWYDNKSIAATQYTPVFLIKNKMSIPMDRCCSKFLKNYEERKLYFETRRMPAYSGSLEEIKKKYASQTHEKRSAQSISDSICKDLEHALYNRVITVNEVLDFLKLMLNDNIDYVKFSSFKRVACFLWYLKYEKEKSTEG